MLQDDLDTFLALAEEFQLTGLMGNSEERFGESNKDKSCAPQQSLSTIHDETVSQMSPKLENQTIFGGRRSLALPINSSLAVPENLSLDWLELVEKVRSMMEKSQNNLGNRHGFAYLCKVCGKEGRDHVIKDHIEANHLEGIVNPCNLCEKTFGARVNLRLHKAKYHQNSTTYMELFAK